MEIKPTTTTTTTTVIQNKLKYPPMSDGIGHNQKYDAKK